ncbi:TetR/AcrR family transcriptional regulator [Tissierella sp. Yu-01]|uniref:TetR/AcrR family transcriptional regulator n=1 Tax=Tissierella sp. Yu-01 TaxID=3035694 RepID=UPI00240E8045|nr:TetR/AcrR family transcriptional regulator [Tissierella sp. Yu-01]WFA09260.1 TetR/AcrR family transcriptional regulator [Tissierella sp. Yu-01]
MNGYERRTKNKQDKIKSAALMLFNEFGIDKTSINDIAKKAHVSPASIYNYFKTKDGLLIELTKDIIESSIEEKETLWNGDLPFNLLLEQAIKNQNLFINQTNLEFLNIFIEESDDAEKVVNEIFNKRYLDLLDKFIEKGRKEGFIKRNISTKAMMYYLKMYQELVQDPKVINPENQGLIGELYDLMLYGLVGTPIENH